MRSTLLLVATIALVGCQEISIDTKPDDTDLPPDTDVGLGAPQPQILVDPLALDFGHLPVDCPAEPQPVTIENIGEADLNVTEVVLDGSGSATFEMFGLPNFPKTLAPGESFQFGVGFAPGDYFIYDKVSIDVKSNDPDERKVSVETFGAGADDAVQEDLFEQVDAGSVDVLWVIDNSSSMSDELRALGREFNYFIQSFVNLGLDYHIGVVTTDMNDPAQSGKLVGPYIDSAAPGYTPADAVAEFRSQTDLGLSGSTTERGLDAAHAALTPPLITGHNDGFYRDDANLAVIVISDEDDSSIMRAAEFSRWLNNRKPDPSMSSFSGMVGPQSGSCGGFPPSGVPAPRYHDAIRRTGGAWADLCSFDTQVFLTYLSYVAAGLDFRFELTREPARGAAEMTVEVAGSVLDFGAFNGWTYDASTNEVVLHGTAIPDPGESVLVSYPFITSCD